MAAQSGEQITIDVEEVGQIFNAPDANPFATGQSAVLGEAALERVLTQLQVRPLRNWEGAQLVVRLPEEQITPELEPSLAAAIRRYCSARIDNNRVDVQLGRKQHFFGLIMVTLIVFVVILLAVILFRTVFAGASTTIQAIVAASISLFAWVIIWDPLEALIFDWAAPARENRALAHAMNLQVVVEKRAE